MTSGGAGRWAAGRAVTGGRPAGTDTHLIATHSWDEHSAIYCPFRIRLDVDPTIRYRSGSVRSSERRRTRNTKTSLAGHRGHRPRLHAHMELTRNRSIVNDPA